MGVATDPVDVFLVDGTHPGRPAQAGRARALPPGRPGDPLRGTPGERGRPSGAADGDRVRAAPRALPQRGAGIDLRRPASPGVGRAALRRYGAGAHLREEAPAQARRRRGQPCLHRRRARSRLPHGPARATRESCSWHCCGRGRTQGSGMYGRQCVEPGLRLFQLRRQAEQERVVAVLGDELHAAG